MRQELLAANLREAATRLIETIDSTTAEQWSRTPGPGVWSIGKDVEHLIEAAGYHQWIVRRTIGDRVPARKPVLERGRMTTELSIPAAISQLRARTDDGIRLLLGVTDAQLDLVTKPPRARDARLGQTIEALLIGHYDGHRRDIEAKQRQLRAGG